MTEKQWRPAKAELMEFIAQLRPNTAHEENAFIRAWQLAVLVERALYGHAPEEIREYLELNQDEFDSLRWEAVQL
jgi:hypothetical protein